MVCLFHGLAVIAWIPCSGLSVMVLSVSGSKSSGFLCPERMRFWVLSHGNLLHLKHMAAVYVKR